jgi:hypothetical protein
MTAEIYYRNREYIIDYDYTPGCKGSWTEPPEPEAVEINFITATVNGKEYYVDNYGTMRDEIVQACFDHYYAVSEPDWDSEVKYARD